MFNFGGITHVIRNPKGHAEGYEFSLVGSVPLAMMEPRKPTTADVMAGRVQKDGFAYYGRKWSTAEQIKADAAKVGAHLCDIPTCACRAILDTSTENHVDLSNNFDGRHTY